MFKHYHSRYHFHYHTSVKRHFYSSGISILIVLVILLFTFRFLGPSQIPDIKNMSYLDIIFAAFASLYRLTMAYLLALIISIPIVIFASANQKLEKFLLPIFDILQSIPTLAFFPVIALVFLKINFFDGAAIFVLFIAMLWNLVFSMIGGLKTIPPDIKSAGIIFKANGFRGLVYVILPSILPYIITGSLLAWAQGWNILIVAEVLHIYIPNGESSQDLFGLGSLLVNAAFRNDNYLFLVSLGAMIIIISLLNFFVWQKLLQLSERYKFD